jgi:hypothetical protein
MKPSERRLENAQQSLGGEDPPAVRTMVPPISLAESRNALELTRQLKKADDDLIASA